MKVNAALNVCGNAPQMSIQEPYVGMVPDGRMQGFTVYEWHLKKTLSDQKSKHGKKVDKTKNILVVKYLF